MLMCDWCSFYSCLCCFFFFKQKTAYEMRISDWSSDVCSSDLDEELVCVSMAARLLFLGLGVEADDKGVFEWKPLTIKMKIFPADNLDVDTLLAELLHANAVRRYEVEGRQYGAIRNFRKLDRKSKLLNSSP